MRLDIKTAKKSVTILLHIQSEPNTEIRITGNGSHAQSIYFDRYPIKTDALRSVIEIPLPLSPNKISIRAKAIKGKANLLSYEVKPINLVYPEEHKGFLKLAKYIAEFAPILPKGRYWCSEKKIKLDLLPVIKGKDGKTMQTPARVNVYKPHIEVAEKLYSKATIAMRMFVLCHEYAHYLANSFDEFLADELGATLYLDAGFSQSEAFYALTDMLPNNPESEARIQRLANYLTSL